MNKELKELFESTGFKKRHFVRILGITKGRYNAIVREGAFVLKPSTFNKFKDKLKNRDIL